MTPEELNELSPIPGPRWGNLVSARPIEFYCYICGCQSWLVRDDWNIGGGIPHTIGALDGHHYCKMCYSYQSWFAVESIRELNMQKMPVSDEYRYQIRITTPLQIVFQCIDYLWRLELAKQIQQTA